MSERILVIANDDMGLYNFRKELLQHFIDRGSEVYISIPNGPRVCDLIKMGCFFLETNVDRRGKSIGNDLKLIKTYFVLYKKVKPNKIISFTIKPNMYGGIVAHVLRIPFFPYVAGLGTPFQKNTRLSALLIMGHRIAFKGAKAVFFENVDSMAFYKKHQIVKENCIKIPGAGVNLEEYPFMEMPDKGHIEFVFVGRVMKEKGIDEFLDASKKIKAEYPDTIINIVGPCEENYDEVLIKLQDHNVIKYWGFQKDVKPIIYKSHCLVLPSYHEGMANVLLEAASMGRILITSDIHGCREAIKKHNGFLIKPKDSNGLYDAMKTVINLDWTDLVNGGIESRKHMETVFDRKRVVRSITDNIYQGGE